MIFGPAILLGTACGSAPLSDLPLSSISRAASSESASYLLADRTLQNNGGNHSGDGYDLLAGQRKSSCLNPAKVEIRSYPLNRATDSLFVAYTRTDLAKKLHLEVNAGVSALVKSVTGGASVKTTIAHETSMTSQDITAVAEYRYLKDEIVVYDSVPNLAEDKLSLLKQDKVTFRNRCGDKFTRSIKTGASLYLVFKAEKIAEVNASQTDVEAALKIGFGAIFNINSGTQLTREQKSIIDSFRISTRCYSEGVSAHPCADNMLNTTALTLEDNTILARIKAAKAALATEIDQGTSLTTVHEEMEPYPIPDELSSKGYYEVFYDYRDHLNKLQQWLSLEDQVTAICSMENSASDECSRAKSTIAGEIENCAYQRNFTTTVCRLPAAHEFDAVLNRIKALALNPIIVTNDIRTELNTGGRQEEFVRSLNERAFKLINDMAASQGLRPYNVIVFNNNLNHDKDLKGVVYTDTFRYRNVTFTVWAFESGWFWNKAAGGFHNWAMYGWHDHRVGDRAKKVNFYRP
jgi:hypothetical protein